MPGDDLRGEAEVMPLAEWPKVVLPAEAEDLGVPCPDHLRAEIYEKLGIIANRVVEAPPSKADEMRKAFWGNIKRP